MAKINQETILAIIILVGFFLVMLFNIAFLPEDAFQDAAYYLALSKDAMEGKAITWDFPLKIQLTAYLFKFTGLSIERHSKIFPLLIFFAYWLVLIKFTKELFQRRTLLPEAIVLSSYWILNFFSINYSDSLLALFVLCFAYLFYIQHKKTEGDWKSHLHYINMVLLIIAVALTKLSGLALALPMFLLLLILLLRKSRTTGIFVILTGSIIVCLLLFGLHYEEKLSFLGKFITPNFKADFAGYVAHLPYTYLRLFMYPPNECLNQIIFGVLNEPIKAAFIIFTLPLFFLFVMGVINGLKGNFFWKAISLLTIFNFGIIISQYLNLSYMILPRYLVPTIAFAAILATKQYLSLDKVLIKQIVFVSFVIFAAYSLTYSTYSTYHHHKVYLSHQPSVEFAVQGLYDKKLVASFKQPIFRLNDLDVEGYFGGSTRGDFFGTLESKNIEFIYLGCYRESIDEKTIDILLREKSIRKIYGDACARIYEILFYLPVEADNLEMLEKVDVLQTKELDADRDYQIDSCH